MCPNGKISVSIASNVLRLIRAARELSGWDLKERLGDEISKFEQVVFEIKNFKRNKKDKHKNYF